MAQERGSVYRELTQNLSPEISARIDNAIRDRNFEFFEYIFQSSDKAYKNVGQAQLVHNKILISLVEHDCVEEFITFISDKDWLTESACDNIISVIYNVTNVATEATATQKMVFDYLLSRSPELERTMQARVAGKMFMLTGEKYLPSEKKPTSHLSSVSQSRNMESKAK